MRAIGVREYTLLVHFISNSDNIMLDAQLKKRQQKEIEIIFIKKKNESTEWEKDFLCHINYFKTP